MITYFPLDEHIKLDQALRLCQTSGKALDAGEYADVRIADVNNGQGHWDQFTFVDSWRVAGNGLIFYVHKPLFTPDEIKGLMTGRGLEGAFQIDSSDPKISDLIQHGNHLRDVADSNDNHFNPREVWYFKEDELSKCRSGTFQLNSQDIYNSEIIYFLNGIYRTIAYLDRIRTLKSMMSFMNLSSDASGNSYMCRPLAFGNNSSEDLDAGNRGLKYGRFVAKIKNLQ